MAMASGGTKVVGTKTAAPAVKKSGGRSFGGSKMKGGYCKK
jgi:hypothetical protein